MFYRNQSLNNKHMKVQEVKKECLASVGLSVELSNSEIGSIDRLLWTVDNAIDAGINQAISIGRNTGKQYDFEDDVPVVIDLRSLKKIQWLLRQFTKVNRSELFNEANREFNTEVNIINQRITSEPI